MTLSEAIIETIASQSGIKGVHLVLDVMAKCNIQSFNTVDYHRVLASLVEHGDIVELEYVDPDTAYRIKSLYFKKGTHFVKIP